MFNRPPTHGNPDSPYRCDCRLASSHDNDNMGIPKTDSFVPINLLGLLLLIDADNGDTEAAARMRI